MFNNMMPVSQQRQKTDWNTSYKFSLIKFTLYLETASNFRLQQKVPDTHRTTVCSTEANNVAKLILLVTYKPPHQVLLERTYPLGSTGLSWAARYGDERWWTLGTEEKEEKRVRKTQKTVRNLTYRSHLLDLIGL
jgi:hypothetical protein